VVLLAVQDDAENLALVDRDRVGDRDLRATHFADL